jgi:hypothetical protein
MRRIVASFVFFAVLGTAAPAVAAPNWRQPFVTAANGRAPAVAVDPAGNTYVAFTAPDGLKVTRRAPGAGFDSPETVTLAAVPDTQFVAGAAIGADNAGNVTVAWLQNEGFNVGLWSAAKPAGGGWEQPQRVDSNVHPGRGFALAVGGGGLAAVSYASFSPDERLTVALRPAGAPSWSAPERIGTVGTTDTPRVAVGADNTVAATTGLYGYGPRAFVRPSASGAWEGEQELDPDPQLHASAPTPAVDDGGGVLVAWTHSLAGGDYRIDTRYRPDGAGAAFGAVDSLPDLDGFAIGTEFFNGPVLGFDPAGNATIVWRQYFGQTRQDLYGATRPPGDVSPFGAPQALSTGSGAEYARLALDAGGTALVVWRGFEDAGQGNAGTNKGPVFASTRPAGGSFSAADVLTPFGGTAPAVDAGSAGAGIASWGRSFPEGCSQVESALWNEGAPGPFPALGRVCTPPGASTPPPPTGQTPPPLPRDATAPRAKLSASSRQRALKAKAVTLKIVCDEACAPSVAPKVDHKPPPRQKKVKARQQPSKSVTGPARK